MRGICFFFFQSIQIWLKSHKGPIEVYLCPEEAPEGGAMHDSSTSEEEEGSMSFSEDSCSSDSFKGEPRAADPQLNDINHNNEKSFNRAAKHWFIKEKNMVFAVKIYLDVFFEWLRRLAFPWVVISLF